MLPTRVIPGATVFPRIRWRWEAETDILSGSYRTAQAGEAAGSLEISSPDGAVSVLDVVEGELCGVDIVIWPDIETVTGLRPPAPAMAGRITLAPEVSTGESVETSLAVETDATEQVFHLRLGSERPVTVVQVADYLLIEVDAEERLAGFWLTGVPPFPADE